MEGGTRPIPTSASNSKLPKGNKLQMPEEASASESASEITIGVVPLNYPGNNPATTGNDGISRPLCVADTPEPRVFAYDGVPTNAWIYVCSKCDERKRQWQAEHPPRKGEPGEVP